MEEGEGKIIVFTRRGIILTVLQKVHYGELKMAMSHMMVGVRDKISMHEFCGSDTFEVLHYLSNHFKRILCRAYFLKFSTQIGILSKGKFQEAIKLLFQQIH